MGRSRSLHEVLELGELRARVTALEEGPTDDEEDEVVDVAVPESPPPKSGPLILDGNDVWCAVEAGALAWFEDRSSTRKLGSATLGEAEVTAWDGDRFCIERPHSGRAEFEAENEASRDAWVAAVSAAIDWAKMRRYAAAPRKVARWIDQEPWAMDADDALNCQAFGPGLYAATCGEATSVTVATHDAGGELLDAGGLELSARLESPTRLYAPPVRDLGRGEYGCDYVACRAGDYELSILLRDEFHVFGSPFPVRVAPARADLASSELKGEVAEVGRPSRLELVVRDRFGNDATADVKVRLDGHGALLGGFVEESPGRYRCVYRADGPDVEIRVSVDGSPFRPFRPVLAATKKELSSTEATVVSPDRSQESLQRRLAAVGADDRVRRVLDDADVQLRQVFRHYATAQFLALDDPTHKRRHGLLALARDFDVVPHLVNRPALRACYAAVHTHKRADPAGISFAHFRILLALIADLAFATFDHLYPTRAAK